MRGLFCKWTRRKTVKLSASKIQMECVPELISVVLPVYNGEKYLAEAIESVLAQTWQKWELLVVDDGSVDASADIAGYYAKKDLRIRVIRQENQKLPRALNRGFGEAKGEFYTWLSADNRMLPHCLSTLAEELIAKKEIDMVYGNMTLIDGKGERLTGHGWFELPPKSGHVILPSSTVCLNHIPNNTIGASFLYRSGCEAVLGGYSPLQYLLEDYDYFMRLNSLFNIRHSRERAPLYEYRIHPDSLTAHDAELGITAARPKLMEFDARRRQAYQEEVGVSLSGETLTFWTGFKKAGLKKTDEKIRFFFSAKGGSESQEVLEMPVYRIIQDGDGVYTVLSVTYPEGWVRYECGANPPWRFSRIEDMVEFLRMRTVSDWLKQEEMDLFSK